MEKTLQTHVHAAVSVTLASGDRSRSRAGVPVAELPRRLHHLFTFVDATKTSTPQK